jgi:hypothetical protein
MLNIVKRLAWFGLLAVMALAVYVGIVRAGPLDPPGPVGSTMKTLDEIPGSWHRTLSATGSDPCNTARFRCVMNNEAVLDLETGLVWQREPVTIPTFWKTALYGCWVAQTGGRGGWRLPKVEEVESIFADLSGSLPSGHPFVNVSGDYWTATIDPGDNGRAISAQIFVPALNDFLNYWCVRGPGGVDGGQAH